MMIRSCFLMGVLAVGLTALPSDGHGFDGGNRRIVVPCVAPQTAPCRIAGTLPAERMAMPAGTLPPLPLPRPPNLGQPAFTLPEAPR